MNKNGFSKKIAPCRDQDIRSETSFRASLPSENGSEMEGVALVARRPSPSWYRKSAQRIPRNMPATRELPMRRKFGILVHFVGERLGDDRKRIPKKKDSGTAPLANALHIWRTSGKLGQGDEAFSSVGVSPTVAHSQPDDTPGRERSSSGSNDLRSILSLKRRGIPRHCAVVASPLSGGLSREAEIDAIVARTKYYSRQIKDRGQA